MRKSFYAITFLIASTPAIAQIYPSNDTVLCGTTIQFYAAIGQSVGINADDYYSPVQNIGFSFTFYGNTYTQFLASPNGYLSFTTANAGLYSQWPIAAAIPSTANPMNTIMAPWHDSDPGIGGTIRYSTVGVAPNRALVVEFCQVPMYSCNNLLYTSQIILYEGSNRIETHIANKPTCSSWNGGYAIHGLHNSTGTIAHVVTGRNYPTNWTVANDGYEFVPSGTNAYTINPIPFAPIPLGSSVAWTVNGVSAGNNASITVTPGPVADTVIGTVTFTSSCAGITGTYTDTVIVFPNPMTVAVSSVNTSCSVNDGSATAVVTGGISPITVSWNTTPPSLTNTINNLDTGIYIVTVVDSSGCTVIDTAIINFDTNIDLTLAGFSNVDCHGDSTGSAQTSLTGAVGTPTYQWTTSPVQTTANAVNLPAGFYWVYVTDADNCRDSVLATISQPPPITTTVQSNPVMCPGGNNGSSVVFTQGGSPAYSYSWATTPPTTTQIASNLTAGVYLVTVTDSKGCVKVDSAIVIEPDPILATINVVEPTCYGGSDGTATVTSTSGGSPGYTYTWSTVPVQSGSTASGLASGFYFLTIKDSKGCENVDTIGVSEPDSITLTFDVLEAECGHDNGAATALAGGGMTPFTYLWEPGGQTSQTASGLPAGLYNVTVTDAQGCSTQGQTEITEYLGVIAGFTFATDKGDAPFNLTFNNTSSGASSYSWTFDDGTSDVSMHPNHTFNAAGRYTITLTACYTSACCDSVSYEIEVIDQIIIPNVFTPDNDGMNDQFKLNTSNLQSLNMSVYNRWGSRVFFSDQVNAVWNGQTEGGTDLAEGTYYYNIVAVKHNGQTENRSGTVTLLRD